jgi:hypothetical protein
MQQELSRRDDIGGIRPDILKRYYGSMYGHIGHPQEAFLDATFEEYFRLLRINYTTISRRKAAERSKNPAFKAMAATFPEDPLEIKIPAAQKGAPKERKKSSVFEKLAALDLSSADLPADLHSLFLDRVKSVSGLERLRNLNGLRIVEGVLCGSDERPPAGVPMDLARIDLNECEEGFVRALLGMARAEWVRVVILDPPAFDLAALKAHHALRALYVSCGLALGAHHLAGLPLETLWLANVPMDGGFRKALEALGGTLRELNLANDTPFGPDELPALPRLEKCIVPAYPEFREQWIAFAVSYPGTRFSFPPLSAPSAKQPTARIAEIHRGVDILEMKKGAKTWYEVWGDLAARLQGERISNNDLLARIEPAAKKRKLKIRFSSEGDELRMQSASLDDLEACLDEFLPAT